MASNFYTDHVFDVIDLGRGSYEVFHPAVRLWQVKRPATAKLTMKLVKIVDYQDVSPSGAVSNNP